MNPRLMTRSRAFVKPFLGDGARGPVYGPEIEIPCGKVGGTRIQQSNAASDLVATTTLYVLARVVPVGATEPVEAVDVTTPGTAVRIGSDAFRVGSRAIHTDPRHGAVRYVEAVLGA